MTPLRTLDLFSGIGGFALGLERTGGFRTVAFCEIEPFPRRVLAKHWPEVPCYDDVRTLTAERLAADGIAVDVVCGGFPCQDISPAGRGEGINGARSGLWREYARIVGECRPDWVVVENSHALRTRGADRVLGDLEAFGYACWPCVVGAAHAGAPHRRKRVFVLAHADREQHEIGKAADQRASADIVLPDAIGALPHGAKRITIPHRSQGRAEFNAGQCPAALGSGGFHRDADCLRELEPQRRIPEQRGRPSDPGWWITEPAVGRVAPRVPHRVDRLKALGNAVVPQVIEAIGRAILATRAECAA